MGPTRTCVGCRGQDLQAALWRLAIGPGGQVVLDPHRRLPGRGAYLHPDPACVAAARRRHAVQRALGSPPGAELDSQLDDLGKP